MKRGYSKAFTPRSEHHGRYLLDKIPVTLWTDVKAKAKRQGISMRALILGLLKDWLSERQALSRQVEELSVRVGKERDQVERLEAQVATLRCEKEDRDQWLRELAASHGQIIFEPIQRQAGSE